VQDAATAEVPIDWRVTEAYEFKDGKVIRAIFGFPNVAAALEAIRTEDQATRVH
jgi:hypothetical protein